MLFVPLSRQRLALATIVVFCALLGFTYVSRTPGGWRDISSYPLSVDLSVEEASLSLPLSVSFSNEPVVQEEGTFVQEDRLDEEEKPETAAFEEEEGPLVQPEEPDRPIIPSDKEGTKQVVHLTNTGAWDPPLSRDPSDRFLAYLPHSGISNQRISLVNALTLSKLLNRTLIVPPLTLGSGVDWHPPPRLLDDLVFVETLNARKCEAMHWTIRKEECGKFWNSMQASWSWFLDPEAIKSSFNVVERPTHSPSWYSDVLQLEPEDIHTFPDPDRRSLQISEKSTADDDDTASLKSGDQIAYTHQMDIQELLGMDDVPLLEFGSLFGSTRLRLRNEESLEIRARAETLMAFKQPILDIPSDAVANRLGGLSSYIGVHLRVGGRETSPKFHDGAEERVKGIFTKLCQAVGLSKKDIQGLIEERFQTEEETLNPLHLTIAPPDTAFRPTSELRCPYELHDTSGRSSRLRGLNTVVYVSTDSKEPRRDPLIEIFTNSFPCLFFFNDFHPPPKSRAAKHFQQSAVVELDHFLDDVVDEAGDPLARFLAPYVESEIIAKGSKVIGTPSSTFSTFARTTLFDAYHQPIPETVLDEEPFDA